MIAVVAGLAVAVLVGAALAGFFGSVSGSKGLGVVVGLALAPTLLFVPLAIGAADTGTSRPVATIWHEQLEADRVMTQQMAVAGGQGMDAQMAIDGMLQRSGNTAYVSALEQHITDFNQMAGVAP